jgi:hypothetical protein
MRQLDLQHVDAENLDQLKKLLADPENLNLIAAVYRPVEMVFEFPPYYVALFKLIVEKIDKREYSEVYRIAVGLPRGFAKTTFLKILCTYCIIHGLLKFLLIVCAAEDRAEDFLFDLNNTLSSDNIKGLYGSWEAGLLQNRKDRKVSVFNGRQNTIMAIPAMGAIRGVVMDLDRPDFILMDDAQSKKNDRSDAERRSLEIWTFQDLFKARPPSGAIICYLGNMYSSTCLLYQFKQSREWDSIVTGAILANGESLWPELWPLAALIKDYQHDASVGQGDAWFAEVMNMPISSTQGLIDEIPASDVPFDRVKDYPWTGGFITVDPAGFKEGADDNVVVAHMLSGSQPFIVEGTAGRFDPEQVIEKAVHMALRWRIRGIFIESAAYQMTLRFWLQKYLKANQLEDAIEAFDINHSKQQKLGRIQTFNELLKSGEYQIADPAIASAYLWEALMYDKALSNNQDNIMDACAMGNTVINKYFNEIQGLIDSSLSPIDGELVGASALDTIERRS